MKTQRTCIHCLGSVEERDGELWCSQDKRLSESEVFDDVAP